MRRAERMKVKILTTMDIIKELVQPINLLSLSRIPLAILAIILFENKIALFTILVLACLTDMFDGKLARKYGPSKYGAAIDGFADKVAIGIVLIFLLLTYRLLVWQFLVIAMRDIIMGLIAVFVMARLDRERILRHSKARTMGKITTAGQFVVLLWLFSGLPYLDCGVVLLGLISLAALVDYMIHFNNVLRKKE